jgi:N6-adenosine-specific RNA methylase IME4
VTALPYTPFAELSPPYSTIVADPPWALDWHAGRGVGRSGRDGLPYSTMPLEDILALPVAELAAPSAHLWLWTTHGFLWDARSVAQAWGFRFTYLLTWAKPGLGMGGRFRHSCEYVLFCERGPQLPVINRRDIGTWFGWPAGLHSAKPDAFMDLVENVSPGPYVELFCRRPRMGWDSWGHGYEATA